MQSSRETKCSVWKSVRPNDHNLLFLNEVQTFRSAVLAFILFVIVRESAVADI